MKSWMAISGIVLLMGCSKAKQKKEDALPTPAVNNPIIQYTNTLQQDVSQARRAADAANRNIAATEQRTREAAAAGQE